jgi:hypothetical protein
VPSNVIVIYDVWVPHDRPTTPENVRRRRRADELENLIENWDGLIIFPSTIENHTRWLAVITALAPNATVLAACVDAPPANKESDLALLCWTGSFADLFDQANQYIQEQEKSDVIDLKNARGVEIDQDKFQSVSESWELLTRRHIDGSRTVNQEEFDAFLSGDANWPILSAGVARDRGPICALQTAEDDLERPIDPIAFVRDAVSTVDQMEVDPQNAINQILIFAEQGSGCSTVLRQIGLALARDGFPTLLTKPQPRELSPESPSNLIIHIQDRWSELRKGPG